ncbi:hydantoinase/oxoprolinase family protein [Uniformispora flossi]|uniref:hydantoinase/oxoprolinase family protein n=1 Tax=Uniformispora flossi TaxID=3390723 RepID=UPI003C2F88D5
MPESTPATGGAVIGVDVGGTFTDTVLSVPGAPTVTSKVLTTPDDPAVGVCRGIAEALSRARIAPSDVTAVVHGTTLATNVILEQRGVRVAFVTTEGFGDLFRLGREARVEEDRYDLDFRPPAAPIPPGWVVEVPERATADGGIRRPLTPAAAEAAAARVAALRPDAVAVCLLHSWARPDHEERLATALGRALPDAYLALSSRVWPEVREYERAMTTLLSAYVGPVMTGYLDRLADALADLGVRCGIRVMDSAGDVMAASAAAATPVRTVESGGAAGIAAAARVARRHAGGRAISFDMGGTTAKAGIVRDGRPGITYDFQVGGKGSFGTSRAGTGLPVKGPVVDLSEVGAGGGSIAWVDEGGALRVGPRSAGAHPGPACYGAGGTAATVTDANAVLGLFGGEELAGGVRLDLAAAEKAVREAVGDPLGLPTAEAAQAIRAVAIAHMATAIRLVTVQRGLDPREFPIVAFGGAGAMHAADLAAMFGITEILVPRGAGVMAAHGLAAATPGVERVRTLPMRLDTPDTAARAAGVLAGLAAACRTELGLPAGAGTERASLDMRYLGQSHQLAVPLPDGAAVPDAETLAAHFRAAHEAAYGVAPHAPVELVTFRIRVTSATGPAVEAGSGAASGSGSGSEAESRAGSEAAFEAADADLPRPTAGAESAVVRPAFFTAAGGWTATAVWTWDRIAGLGSPNVSGPAVIRGAESTVVVPPGWTVHAAAGHLLLRRAPGAVSPVSAAQAAGTSESEARP